MNFQVILLIDFIASAPSLNFGGILDAFLKQFTVILTLFWIPFIDLTNVKNKFVDLIYALDVDKGGEN